MFSFILPEKKKVILKLVFFLLLFFITMSFAFGLHSLEINRLNAVSLGALQCIDFSYT